MSHRFRGFLLLAHQQLPRVGGEKPRHFSWLGALSQSIFIIVPVCASQPVFILDSSVDLKMLAAVSLDFAEH